MSDALKLALRISAIDLFSGVLRHFNREVAGTGAAARAMQKDYDNLVKHTANGLKALSVGVYLGDKMKPMVEQAVQYQDAQLKILALIQNQYSTAEKTKDVMAHISDNANHVASHMMYNAVAVLDATKQLVQAGVPVAAIIDQKDATGRVTRHGAAYQTEAFAEVNGLDSGFVARNVANIAHSYQLTSDQYGPMVDTLQKALTLGSGDATELFHNMQNFGAIAHLGHTSVRDSAVALKVIAPLGEEGGSDLAHAMTYAFGGSARGSKNLERYGLSFYDKQHKFIGLFPMLDKLSTFISSHHMTEQQRNELLVRGFQQTGLKALALLLEADKPGAKSFHVMNKDFDKQPTLAQMVAVRESGSDMSWHEMVTTIQTTEATIFKPLLPQLTAVAKLTNEWAGDLGNLATKHPALAKSISYAAEGAVGIAGLLALYHGGRAAGSAGKLLKGLLGKGKDLAGGLAEGKAIEKLTGVTPVFVTNWPGGFGGLGGLGKVPGVATEAATEAETIAAKGASAAASAARGATAAEDVAANAVKDATAAEKAAANATKATGAAEHIAAAAVEGTKVAGWASKGAGLLKGTRWLGALDAVAWAPIPELSARDERDLQEMEKPDPLHRSWWRQWTDELGLTHSTKRTQSASPPMKLDGTIHIQIDQAGRARVTHAKSNQPNIHMDVGTMLGVP